MKKSSYVRRTEDVNTMGDRVVLFYYLKESKTNERKKYGIEVEMYIQHPDQRTVKETKTMENLFSEREKAEKIIDLLCASTVPPITLSEIISDYLDSENEGAAENLSGIM